MISNFDTVLIANRGEIAVRIARTARHMGLRTVGIHSTADRWAPHVAVVDLSVEIGPPEASRSYLDIERIIDAAKRTGAQAIHPGYGFLSERAPFAQACADAGLVFIGPSPHAIAAMGDKAAAKQRMRSAGVPVVPGYDGDDQSNERLMHEAPTIGFPIMVKATAGGGGKGMRLVNDIAALPDALDAARREAAAAFGSDQLLLERAVMRPRHVEIQVLADHHGHVIHLGERDCSVQRRHQKVVEEAPSPAVGPDLRARMGAAAVAAARSVDYVGAGTVEFLLDQSGEFYFLEMNTRLQVEHPVTEFVTGLDIVEWQMRIARGEPLSLSQDDVEMEGHAIEVRLYAEDPANGFLPVTGTIASWEPAVHSGVRVDAGIQSGSEISSYYDPMIAKVIAHGSDREQARVRLIKALEDTTLLGTATNRAFLVAVLRAPDFASGEATTAFLDDIPTPPPHSTSDVAAVAAWLYHERRRHASEVAPGLSGWSSAGLLRSIQRLNIGTDTHDVIIAETPQGVVVTVDGIDHAVSLDGPRISIDGVETLPKCVEITPGQVLASFPQFDLKIQDLTMSPVADTDMIGEGVLRAPMHGRVIAVDVEPGVTVVKGQRLLAMEAMKLEHAVMADTDGVLSEIVGLGAQVALGHVVARITPITND